MRKRRRKENQKTVGEGATEDLESDSAATKMATPKASEDPASTTQVPTEKRKESKN